MTPMNKSGGPPREWLLKAAEIEDTSGSISVGGLASDFGMLRSAPSDVQPVFGRLIEYARRTQGLSVEKLAEQADVDLAAIVEIETHNGVVPEVRTVYQLAQALNLPAGRLMEVAGLATPKPEVRHAALRFAARSEPTAQLSPGERDAFEEFVKVLVESSDGV
jgi:HTH-type transcriptional regulator, competence development regulator